MKRSTLFALIAAAVIVAAAIVMVSFRGEDSEIVSEAANQNQSQGSNQSQASDVPASTQTSANTDELMTPGPLPEQVLGDANAPVTVVEYASLSCSHCAQFHRETLPEVKTRYIETGKVRFVFRDFPLDQYATAGSMLARCGGEGKFFPIVDAFFQQQNGLLSAQDPFQWLQGFGKQVGYTQESLEACLSNQELMDNILSIRQRASEKFGVSSTPTFFINGQIHRGAMTIEEFAKAIDPLLKS